MLSLNLGCGTNRKRLYRDKFAGRVIHVDMNPDVDPDVVHNLNAGLPMRLAVNTKEGVEMVDIRNRVDEIHAYYLIGHIGVMGDTHTWFKFWKSCWDALRPDGRMHIIEKYYLHKTAVGDPSRSRLLSENSFAYLNRTNYVGREGLEGGQVSQLDIDFDLPAERLELRTVGKETIPAIIEGILTARKTDAGELIADSKLLEAVG